MANSLARSTGKAAFPGSGAGAWPGVSSFHRRPENSSLSPFAPPPLRRASELLAYSSAAGVRLRQKHWSSTYPSEGEELIVVCERYDRFNAR
jgi:hypothetical protein